MSTLVPLNNWCGLLELMIEWPDPKNENVEKRGISGIRAKALHMDLIKENEINTLMKKRENSLNNPPSN